MAVEIDIVGSFKAKKAFKDAENSLGSLDKFANKLAKQLGGLFAVDKIIAFSKSSIDAFGKDQRAAALLSNQLKNIGYSNASKQAEDFIATMQQQTGILDDQLRPAYSQLARVTGSITATQKILSLAFDVASGTGEDYQTVIDALSKAYIGNTKGLAKLNTGLTTADLKTKSFADITLFLSKQFKGAGATALDTYTGKLALLKVSVENAQETIGKGFIDAFSQIAHDGDFKTVTSGIENMAQNVSDTLLGIGTILGEVRSKFNSMPSWAQKLFSNPVELIPVVGSYLSAFQQTGKKTRIQQSQPSGVTNFLNDQAAAQTRREEAAKEKERQRNAAKLLASQNAQNKLSINNLKLQKAAAVFDMKKIQITAALKSATDAETITRLQLMLAIENQQGDLAAELEKKLTAIQEKNKTLTTDLANVKDQISGINALSAQPFTDMAELASRLGMTIPETQALLDTLAKTPNPFGPMLDSVNQLSRVLPSIVDATGAISSRGIHNIPDASSLIPLSPATGSTGASSSPINITVNGAIDPVSTANQIGQILSGAAGSTGTYTGLGYSWLQALGLTP